LKDSRNPSKPSKYDERLRYSQIRRRKIEHGKSRNKSRVPDLAPSPSSGRTHHNSSRRSLQLGGVSKSIGHLAEQLGCRTCFSGADCTFLHERDFIINEKLEIRASTGISIEGGDPIPARLATATLPAKVSNNLEQIRGVVANIAGRLGCSACCSGFDILFRQELDFVVNEAGEVRG
jgi:hypothetical protein